MTFLIFGELKNTQHFSQVEALQNVAEFARIQSIRSQTAVTPNSCESGYHLAEVLQKTDYFGSDSEEVNYGKSN